MIYENKLESQFNIIWHKQEEIKATVKISTINDIKGYIKIIKTPKTKMETMFNILWQQNTNLKGRCIISHQDNTLIGKIKIYSVPKNKMEAEFRVKLPEKKYIETSVVKDTYVTNLKPSLNYGKSSIIKVGTDDNNFVYRSLLQYKVPKMIDNMYVTRAYVKLYSDDDNAFENLEVSLPSKTWGEYNTVWYGQPPRYKILNVNNLEGGKYEYHIDVTEAVKQIWTLYPFENMGIILKSKDESIKQIKNFGTKESNTPSKLCIEYFDIDLFNTSGALIGGKLRVKRTETSDILSSISVFRHSGESILKAYIHVHNQDMIEGKANSAAIVDILQGRVLSDRLHKDLDGYVFSSKENLYGHINVNARSELDGYCKVHPNSNINGFVDVRYINDIKGTIIVNPLEREDLPSKVQISDYNDLNAFIDVVYKSELQGKIKIIYKTEINGKIRSTYIDVADLKGKLISILKSDMLGKVKINPVGFTGKINVNTISFIEGKIKNSSTTDIIAKVHTNEKNDLDGFVKARLMEIDDLEGAITIDGNPLYGKDDYYYVFII